MGDLPFDQGRATDEDSDDTIVTAGYVPMERSYNYHNYSNQTLSRLRTWSCPKNPKKIWMVEGSVNMIGA